MIRKRSAVPPTNSLSQRRGSWRAQPTKPAALGGWRKTSVLLGLLLAVLLVIAMVAAIVVAPLYRWQTGFVMLVVDQYQLGTLDAVPYASRDKAAFKESLKGLLSAVGTEPVDLVGLDSADTIRDQLGPQIRQMPLRYKDVLIAYIRGQSLVAPPEVIGTDRTRASQAEGARTEETRTEDSRTVNGWAPTAGVGIDSLDSIGGKACFVASDLRVRGPRPRELVPLREIVEAIGSAKPKTTLFAIDLGDIQWDPRIGVVANVVSKQLDVDFAAAKIDAVNENWIIGSHDLFESSFASVPAERTFFARALELALAGKADEKPWGDANKVVELDEIARYVEAWTGEWVRRSSGGRSRQRPVVWKLGKGRVPIDSLPKGIAIIRVAAKPAAKKTAAKADAKDGEKAAPGTDLKPESAPAAGGNPAAQAVPQAPAPQAVAPPRTAAAVPRPPVEGLIRLVAAESPVGATPATAAAPAATVSGAEKPSAEAKPAASPQQPEQVPAGKPLPAGGAKDGKPEQVPPPAAAAPVPAPAPARPLDAWELLDAIGNRSAGSGRDSADERVAFERAAPLDYAPHIWRELFALAASAELRSDTAGGAPSQATATLDAIAKGLTPLQEKIASGSTRSLESSSGSPAVDQLIAAHNAAESAGIFRKWNSATEGFRSALVVRNDAVETMASAIDYLGRSSGGAATPAIDPANLLALTEQIGRLSTALERQSVASTNERRIQIDPLEMAAKTVAGQMETIRSMLDRLIQAMLQQRVGFRTDASYGQCVAALRSPLLSAQRRRVVREAMQTGGEAALNGQMTDAVISIEPTGRAEAPDTQPRRLDRESLRNIAALSLNIVALVDAAGLASDQGMQQSENFLETRGDAAQVRKAAVSLSEASGKQDQALRDVVMLGGLLARMYARFAADAALEASQYESVHLSESEWSNAVLRVIDPRDTAILSQTVLVGLPGWSSPDAIGLRLVAGNASLSLDRSVDARITGSEGRLPPIGSMLRFMFDPADVQLRLPGGGSITAGRPMQVGELPFRADGLTVEVVANRTATASDTNGAVKVTVMCESGWRLETATMRFKLPAQRAIRLVARRTPAAIEPTLAGGWARAKESVTAVDPKTVDSKNGRELPPAERIDQAEATLGLVAIPGRATAWELGLENSAEIPRTVTVELHDISVASLVVETSERQRGREWGVISAALRDGTFAAPPLAVVKKFQLPVGDGVTTVVIPPAAAAPPPEALPAPKGAPASEPAATAALPIGPELAVVIREETPGEPARVWVNRLLLQVEPPSSRLAASATWIRQDRSISVKVDAINDSGRAALLPPEGIRASLVPLPDVGNQKNFSIRKSAAVISATRLSDTMIATWNGSDRDGRAWLAVDVDGYPRAFVFGVDCSPPAEEKRQNPQFDWRSIRCLSPVAEETLVKAPVAAIPMTLAVDAPPDAQRSAASRADAADGDALVSLFLREVRSGSFLRQEGRLVWGADSDRQVVFTREKPAGTAALAVRATVTDWDLKPSGQGYENVDVEAEARLVLPGEQQPLVVRRRFVFDARPPTIETPPVVNVVVGRPLVIPLRVMDDPRESLAQAPGTHIPGVSGVEKVEWAIDAKGDGKPEAWLPAVGLGGAVYELRVPTTTMPPGRQTPLLVRATDRAGHSNEPMRVWLDTAPLPAKNSIEGRVTLKGRGEEGVPVTADGPGAPKPTRSGKDGKFKFSDLEPGDYKLQARGPVRNQSYQSEVSPVTVAAPPAPASSVTLELK
jgi:hypothetical protein